MTTQNRQKSNAKKKEILKIPIHFFVQHACLLVVASVDLIYHIIKRFHLLIFSGNNLIDFEDTNYTVLL